MGSVCCPREDRGRICAWDRKSRLNAPTGKEIYIPKGKNNLFQSATNPAEFLLQPRVPLAAIPTPAQQQSLAPSPTAPKALPGGPSLTKQVMCLISSSQKANLDVDCASSVHRRTSSRLDPALWPAHDAVMGGKHRRRRQGKDPALFLPCSLPAKP